MLDCLYSVTQTLSRVEQYLDEILPQLPAQEYVTAGTSIQANIISLHEILLEIANSWDRLHHQLYRSGEGDRFTVSTSPTAGVVGRPPFLICQEQLEYLSSLSFSWTAIAHILGVSRYTVWRRRRRFGMDSIPEPTDHELQETVLQLRAEHPDFGEALVIGHFQVCGQTVRRQRIRVAIHHSDPINTSLRWRGTITPRRPYSVPGPNSLWHIGKYLFVHACDILFSSVYIKK